SSIRLYKRLDALSSNPNDPECVDEVLVVAFGAFEKYYICWRNRAGQYRQDGYGLPERLRSWLFPVDGPPRDYATLQVVFGRGDEFFASDRNGKIENKDPQ
ncbi:hypothetical protein BDY21DRAFT_268556, partial [Lineolata rhizophorae]